MEEEYRFENRKAYAKGLDSVILQKNVQERDLDKAGKKKHRYLPIPIKDAIADYMFSYWNVIDEKYVILDNMLVCTIKLVYVPDYPEADELFCTGSAAVLIQSAKNSLEYQLPAVRSESIGNAFGSLGNIFGRNLARVLKKGTDIPDAFSLRTEKEKKEETKPEIEQTEIEEEIVDTPF